MKRILSVITFLLAQMALATPAFDNTRCPADIQFHAVVEKVAKSSIYKSVPGWLESQRTLVATKEIQAELKLTEKKQTACVYKDLSGHVAILSAPEFFDAEDNESHNVDLLTVKMKMGQSNYVTFLPIKNYATSGIQAYSNPYRLKIKTQLIYGQDKRLVNFDLGMISISVK